MSSKNITSVSDKDFAAILASSDKPVLILETASWCSPCRVLHPVLEKVAEEKANDILFLEMDIDDNQETPKKYGVRSVPTMILFQGGNEVARTTGIMNKAALTEFIENNITLSARIFQENTHSDESSLKTNEEYQEETGMSKNDYMAKLVDFGNKLLGKE